MTQARQSSGFPMPDEMGPGARRRIRQGDRASLVRATQGGAIGCCILVLAMLPGCSRKDTSPAPSSTSPAGAPTMLPVLGDLESFRKDQSAAREMCRRLGLPELPDISGIDADGQKRFYERFQQLAKKPQDPDEMGLLGQLYAAQRFPELAGPLYRKAINMAPENYKWHYMLALHREAQGDVETANAEFQRASELQPDFAPVWMRRAWRMIEKNDLKAALGLVDRYIALRPADPFGYVERARIHEDESGWEAAKADLDRAGALGPIGKKGHRLLGVWYRQQGKLEDSKFHLAMSATDQPGGELDDPLVSMMWRFETFRDPVRTLFSDLLHQGRYREALQFADQALDRSTGDAEYAQTCGQIAEAYRQLGEYENAYQYIQKSCERRPDLAAPWVTRALIFLHTGRFEAALMDANRALNIDPELATALYARGMTLIQIALTESKEPLFPGMATPLDRLTLAVRDLERSVEKEPVNLSYLVALATAHGLLANHEAADKLLAIALRISPQDANVLALKAKAEARQSFW